jgi:hypothetical protein
MANQHCSIRELAKRAHGSTGEIIRIHAALKSYFHSIYEDRIKKDIYLSAKRITWNHTSAPRLQFTTKLFIVIICFLHDTYLRTKS